MRIARSNRAWSFVGSLAAARMIFIRSARFSRHHLREDFLHVPRALTIPVSLFAA